jgi:hypothetical protein
MNRLKWIRNLTVVLATLVLATQNSELRAGDPKVPLSKPPRPNVDISLTNGILAGSIVNRSGDGLQGAEVIIKKGDVEIARTNTDGTGQFTVTGMKAGVYQVSAGHTDREFRVWSEKAAPPAAVGRALMMVGKTDGRGLSGAEARRVIIHSKIDAFKEELGKRPCSN